MASRIAAISELIAAPGQIWLAVESVDLRRGIDGLSSIVQQTLGHSPCAGSAFVFRNRIGHRIKLLLWDGNGVWLCQRRLHQGRFVWPKRGETHCSISSAQWQWLIAGVDWQRLWAQPHPDWQV